MSVHATGPHPTRAALVPASGADLTITEVLVDDPGAGEVLVEIHAAGVCHTDLAARDGLTPFPLPGVLGHEGAGVVVATGPGVTGTRAGDRVGLSFASCGSCPPCWSGRPVQCTSWTGLNMGYGGRSDGSTAYSTPAGAAVHSHFFGQSSLAGLAVTGVRNLVPLADDVPFEIAAPLGCGFQTGASTVLTVFRPEAGRSLVVFGAGAVGLAAVLACHLTPLTHVAAVDVHPERLRLAGELGCTTTVDATGGDVVPRLRDATAGHGFDYAIETSGRTTALRQAVDCLAVDGSVAVVGAPPPGDEVALDVTSMLFTNPSIIGVNQGLSVPRVLIPALLDLWRAGRFPVDRLITTFPFEDLPDAVRASTDGSVVKPVLLVDHHR